MRESDLKKLCEDYLQYQENFGNLFWERINSGEFIEIRGETRRRVKGWRKGSADIFVLKDGFVLFVELKGQGGRVTEEQKDFAQKVARHGATWVVVRDLEELEEALERMGE